MIRFVCDDGTGHRAKVLNAETGEDLGRILALRYGATVTIDQLVTARCEIEVVQMDVTAHATEFSTQHPITGNFVPLAALEFRDGTRVEFAEDGTPKVVTPTA